MSVNQFEKIMKERTDRELIGIVGANRHKYEEEAIEAASSELSLRNIKTEQIDKISKEITHHKENIQKVESNKASKSDRAIHFIVDRIVMFILYVPFNIIITPFVGFVPEDLAGLFFIIYALVFHVFAYAVQEYYFGKTVGKFLTKTKVVKNNGDKISFRDALNRSACRFIPFNWLSFLLGENGWHDALSETKVIRDR